MAVRTLFTRGFGNGTFNGTIPLVFTRGYGIGAAAVLQIYTATVLANISPVASLMANPSMAQDMESNISPSGSLGSNPSIAQDMDSNPSPTREVNSG